MASVTPGTNENGDQILNVDLEQGETSIGLRTAHTYVDKNIQININPPANATTFIYDSSEKMLRIL